MRRILLLDDEVNVLHALQRTLHHSFPGEDIRTEIFSEPELALLRSGEVPFDVVISDYQMLSMNGVEFLKAIKGIQPDAVRLLLTASTEFDTVMKAINQAEVFRYIAKPWLADDLQKTIQLAFVRRDQAMEDRLLADETRAKQGELTPQEVEARRLEAEEPGIMRVKWGPDGSVQLD